MKKLFLAMLIASVAFTSGCKNPISASVEKEGDKTRADMIVELNAAKVDIFNSFKSELDKSNQYNTELINAYMQYLISTLNTPRTY